MPDAVPSSLTTNAPSFPQAAFSARHHADAAFVLTLAGMGWEMLGLSALGGIPLRLLLPVAAAFALLMTATLWTQRSLRAVPDVPQPPAVQKVFKQAIAFEAVVIVLAVITTSILHKPTFIMPFVALAVGLHFLPLARVLNRPLYYFVGAALCVLGVGVPLWVPARIGIHDVPGWQLVIGVLGGIVVWLTAAALLVRSHTLFRAQQFASPTR